MGDFVVFSIVASVVLTVLLNLGLWLARRRTDQPSNPQHARWSAPEQPERESSGKSVQVYFPWKAMLALSVGLTVLVNVVAALRG